MKSIEESVVTAMDGADIELFKFLPYILQDLWEIGADPEIIIKLICKHFDKQAQLHVLDLGCGKGAVSIKVAEKLSCNCHGIDAIPEFIEEANRKAIEHHVERLCKFEVDDIRECVKTLPVNDVIILGAIGPVFGDYYSTLSTLSKCLGKDGVIIIDDGYIENDSSYTHPLIVKKEKILQQISLAGMRLVDDEIIVKDNIKELDDYIFNKLKSRCEELINKYPDKQKIFQNYIKRQEEENNVLENKVVCSTMVIKKELL